MSGKLLKHILVGQWEMTIAYYPLTPTLSPMGEGEEKERGLRQGRKFFFDFSHISQRTVTSLSRSYPGKYLPG